MSNVVPYPARFVARLRRGKACRARLLEAVLWVDSPMVALNALAVVAAMLTGEDPTPNSTSRTAFAIIQIPRP
jgi:hypothetical protein